MPTDYLNRFYCRNPDSPRDGGRGADRTSPFFYGVELVQLSPPARATSRASPSRAMASRATRFWPCVVAHSRSRRQDPTGPSRSSRQRPAGSRRCDDEVKAAALTLLPELLVGLTSA